MATLVLSPSGPWSQIASFFFLLGGSFADLLIVRLMLTLAYVFLLAHVLTGFAPWPFVYQQADQPFLIAVDSVVWAVLGVYVHGSSLFRLLYEERYVPLSEEEEEVWRMFYRRARISRLLFKEQILPGSSFRSYQPGELIVDPTMPQRLHLIVQGRAHGIVKLKQGGGFDVRMVSGDLFEFKHLHLFGVPVGFIDRDMTVHAKSHVRTFSISVERLKQMAGGSAPMRQAWLTVIIAGLARQAELNYYRGERTSDGMTLAALDEWRDPVFSPLLPKELPPAHTPGSGACLWPKPLLTLGRTMRRTFSPPFPFTKGRSGVRHTAMNTQQDVELIGETHRFLSSGPARSQPHDVDIVEVQRVQSKEMAIAAGPSIIAIV
mmetsp:Transcript_13473/g.40880  ORF Transcript_13473/g.40880 Transcript_13473/m.40880 type:complete len:376 (+) Transcript_13473:123-1250(+)|eukprot:scaffold75423_cov39-Tisochrysis_lutea.AAC.3